MLGQLCCFARSGCILDHLLLRWPCLERYLALSGMSGSLWTSAQRLCVNGCLVCIQGSPACIAVWQYRAVRVWGELLLTATKRFSKQGECMSIRTYAE